MWRSYVLLSVGIVAAALVVGIGFILAYGFYQKKRAEKKVSARSDEEKLKDFRVALNAVGFDYDMQSDYVFSQKDPWQKRVGYSRFYDEAAGVMNMILDCEPVTFFYRNRYWLIEFWKGQYGMAAGAEIGIYVTEMGRKTPDFFDGTLYTCVGERDYMDMEFTLYQNGEKLLSRKEEHWWLTAFKPGVFTEPEDLHMECSLRFPDRAMLQAFLDGMEECGYSRDEINVNNDSVTFFYTEPRNKQTIIRMGYAARRIQKQNRRNCRLYLRLTKKYTRTIDKVDYIRCRLPGLYRKLTAIGRLRMQVGIRNA